MSYSVTKGVLRNLEKLTAKRLESLFQQSCRPQAQMLSCKFCEISENALNYRRPLVAASGVFKSP